jgi:TolB protein
MNETGGNVVQLTSHTAPDYSPVWSPDGTRIAFVSDRGGNPDIFVMDANGGNVRQLTTEGGADVDPAWLPDGRIVFTRGGCNGFACFGDLYAMTADGQQLARITTGGLDGHPAASPDGTTIAFDHLYQCGYYYYLCGRDLMVMATSGANQRPLIRDGYDETEPAWSATGSRIALTLNECDYYICGNPIGIRIIRPDGSDPIMIVGGLVSSPTWRR